MTTYLNNYNSLIYKTSIADAYNGVLKISTGTKYGTGNLLYDGRSLLTAAHIFGGVDHEEIKLYIYDGVKNFTINAKVTIYSAYDDVNINGDLAIVTFQTGFDTLYNRYEIYRDSNEIAQDYVGVGYGSVGSGISGYVETQTLYKLKTTNTFDADLKTLVNYANINLTWNPLVDSMLVADFDSGNANRDTIGYLSDKPDLGTGYTEGLIAPGDSGGAAFIDDKIAGIASYGTVLETSDGVGDINSSLDSSFGEMAAYQRVSYYQEWIDKTIRANYVAAPTSRDEVKLVVNEDDFYAYFMVEFLPPRESVQDIVSIEYRTIDATAKAGEDFVFTAGRLNLYEDEGYAIIAVELMNDNYIENDEYFYLEISNPSYGTFGDNIVTLTALRTIIDDDIMG